MASLGLGRLTAVEGRAKLIRPEAVNRAIHSLAIQALTTEYKVFMKSLVRNCEVQENHSMIRTEMENTRTQNQKENT